MIKDHEGGPLNGVPHTRQRPALLQVVHTPAGANTVCAGQEWGRASGTSACESAAVQREYTFDAARAQFSRCLLPCWAATRSHAGLLDRGCA
eukprot:365509-Chlamydomonas_euryale.AAC.13